MDKVELTISKRGIFITVVILAILDMLSTFLIAKSSIDAFLSFEINPLLKFLFVQFGWVSFAFYPILPIILYYGLFAFALWMFNKGKLMKGFFYFFLILLTFHVWIIVNNLILLSQIGSFK